MAGEDRAFEFGLQVANAGSRAEWQETARRAEGAGFDSILIFDHVVDGILSPIAALDAMADATTTLRMGTCVLNKLQALVQHVQVTDDRAAVVGAMAGRLGNDPNVMLDAPYLWVGTVGEIVERAQAARTRWGFDYYVTRSLDATAPIIAALR